MKKLISIGLVLLIGYISAFGQEESVPGYVITNDDIVIECEIFDADWKSNPTEFSYKPYGLLSRVRTGNPQCVKEFVADTTRYVSAEVDAGLLSGLQDPDAYFRDLVRLRFCRNDVPEILQEQMLPYTGADLAWRLVSRRRVRQYEKLFDAAQRSTEESEFINQMRDLGMIMNLFIDQDGR